MKLLGLKKWNGKKNGREIKLLAENKEDLFSIYQLVKKDDVIVFKKQVSSSVEGGKKKNELVLLKIRVVSEEFDMGEESLRYKGVTIVDENGKCNASVGVGKYFSFGVNYEYPFTLIKEEMDIYEEGILDEACGHEKESDTAAVVLQEGIAHVCVLSDSSSVLKQKIEYSLPKKKRSTDVLKFDEKTEKFYKATYEAIKKHYDMNGLRVVILCSPGFYAKTLFEKILEYGNEEHNRDILDNQDKFFVANCSTGYLQGISEVLKNPEYSSVLEDTKYSRDAMILDEFLSHLNEDDGKAWYGEREVKHAAGLDAVDTLLITDELLRGDDVSKRKECMELVEQVKGTGGKVMVFSTLHSSGVELAQLTGIACILKYSIPELEEDEE
ncbi:hypothetical protein TBLA_0D04760 [Henningerozyma blattae CBS 6284]|uniref:Protein DOM34 homolog n=1 Tax=Henningerozyma blattae (strain ATCC 34711 / CBS 6284 / DSM 70876 / NBRC 10599 / NRRL Y-10934 / UCD 77-7) TaxID=1071380 RepID=I2H3M0_HENB6|nr:hypothetical protein TBLA_0D04760 [Tetrapisispora blattae CBS 6284]CCH60972.1 hypothetical protein TBLA_0D04760 [Tetrapisispora blattae CBS 6284]